MNIARAGLMICLVPGIIGLTGCQPKMSKVSQGLTPIAANFYVLHQELGRTRQDAATAAPEQTADHLTHYAELASRIQSLSRDAAAEPELSKKPALRAAIDSCLAADSAFIAAEGQALQLHAAVARIDLQIRDIQQHSRGNSIKMRQAQPELDRLSKESLRLRQDLDRRLPPLAAAADRCRAMLRQYNFIVKAEAIVDYFNQEGIYELAGWQQPPRRPAARPAKKSAKRR